MGNDWHKVLLCLGMKRIQCNATLFGGMRGKISFSCQNQRMSKSIKTNLLIYLDNMASDATGCTSVMGRRVGSIPKSILWVQCGVFVKTEDDCQNSLIRIMPKFSQT